MNRRIVPLLVLLAGLVMAFHPTLFSGFGRLQTDLGDTRLNNYLLEHGWRCLSGEPGVRLWHPPFFHPASNTLAYSDLLLSFGPLYWPWRALGLGEVLSFQLWMIGIAICNFAVSFLFLRRAMAFDQLGSALGAFVISFAASRVGQLDHQQLFPIVFVVGALWAAISMARSTAADDLPGRSRWAPFAFFGCLLAQLYGGYYYFAFSLAILALVALWALAVPRWRRALGAVARGHWQAIIGAGCLALLLALPAVTHYLETAGTVRTRAVTAAFDMLPRLASYAYLSARSWWYGWMTDLPPFRNLPTRHEHAIGLGLLTTVCLLWTAWRNRDRQAVRLAITIALSLGLLTTMFPGGVQLWTVLYRAFPPFQGLRAVSRLWLLLAIPAGIALGWMVSRRGPGARAALVVALAAGACLEQGVTTRSIAVSLVEARTGDLAARVDRSADAFLVVPRGASKRGQNWHNLDAMWASRRTGVPTVNGYSGTRPPGWGFEGFRLSPEEGLDETRQRLDAWAGATGLDPDRIQVLVVDAAANLPEEEPPRSPRPAPPRRGQGGRPTPKPRRTPVP